MGGLATALADAGLTPTLVSNHRPGDAPGAAAFPGQIDVVRLRPTVAWLQLVAPVQARTRDCTVFHGTTGRAPLAAGMPVVVTVHDVTPLSHPEWYPWRDRCLVSPWLRASIRRATAIIAASEATAGEMASVLGNVRGTVRVIGHAADARFHAPVHDARRESARSRFADGNAFWLAVGSLTPRKNPIALVEAYAKAVGALGDAAPNLVLAGPGGRLEHAVRQTAARLGVGDCVRHAGWVSDEDLPALMAAAEAVVCPSLHEGFSLPVAEAIAVGTPVVVSRRGALPEVAGPAGLVTEPDPASLADSLVRLALDPALRAHLASEARNRGPLFRWERVANATAEVYRTVVTPSES